MAGLNFVGDTEQLSEPQLDFIRKVLEKRGFNNNKVVIETAGKKGDNYVAVVKRVIVETNDQPFKLVAKVASTIESLRNSMNTDILFRNEIVMYTEVLPKFVQLLNSENVPKEERFNVPECYGAHAEAPNEIILLEDLQTSDFFMQDRFKPLSGDSIKMVLKDLAIFHSLSYVLRHKNPDEFNIVKEKFINMWTLLENVEHVKKWMQQFEDDLCEILESYDRKKYIKGTVSQLGSISTKLLKYDIASKYSVIQQGDCWTNNILFRFEGDIPIESVMIDYQMSKASSPVSDLLYLMLNCTDHETRRENYSEWLDYYHTWLRKSLDNFGLRVMQVYPKDQLDADLRRYGKLGVILSFVVASAMVKESDEVYDFKEEGELQDLAPEEAAEALRITKLKNKTLEKLKTKVKGIIDSAFEFGYL